MKFAGIVLFPMLFAALAACSTPGRGGAANAGAPAPTAAPAPTPNAQGGAEKVGILAPTNFAAINIWPEAYAGSMLVLEVKPHGSIVKEGDVIAKLDTTSIDEEIHRAELESQSATIRHQGVVERNKLDEQSAKSQLDLAKSSLDRAKKSLEGYKKFEVPFTKRSDDIGKRYQDANLEDETDELGQLEKMYNEDKLVSATEDIVLKRSKRALKLTTDSNALAEERRQYKNDYDQAMQNEQREEQVRSQTEAFERLKVQTDLDARARKDAEIRSADSLREQNERLEKLRRDRESLVLKAPRAGILLHGASKDYRPNRTPARFERGSQLAFRQEIFLIADPAPSAVALDLNDGDLAKFGDQSKVSVQTFGAKPANGVGALHVEGYPRSSNVNEAVFEGGVTLEKPLEGAVYGGRAKVTVDAKAQG